MEVHAHSHTARKKWAHYFWEFLMLFLAVFCGFLAEYQLEHYIEKQRAKDFALSLHRDLAADTANFNTTANRLNFCTKKIDTLVGLLGNAGQVQENAAAIYNLSAYAFIFPSATPNESTLQQLLNSGSLRYFKDDMLVDSIKYYNNRIQLFRDFSSSSVDLNNDFRKAQMQIIDINRVIGFIQTENLFSADSLVNYDDLAFFKDEQVFTSDPLRLKEYANWCGLKKFYITNSIYRYNDLKTQATSILKLLDKKYHIN